MNNEQIIESLSAEIESIANKYELAPIDVEILAENILDGMSDKQIEERLLMDISVAYEYPNNRADREQLIHHQWHNIVADLKPLLEAIRP